MGGLSGGLWTAYAYLCDMIKRKRALTLDIIVPPIFELVVCADNDLPTPSRQLHGRQLLLVVFLEGGNEGLDEIGLFGGEGFDVCEDSARDLEL